MQPDRSIYYSKPDLRERGWTDAAIKRFAPNHDAERPNPMYRSSAPMKLWLKEAIDAIEASAAFQDFQSGSARRAVVAQKALKTKVDRLLDKVRTTKIVVERVSESVLLDLSIEHYNDRHFFCIDAEPASRKSDLEFLIRIRDNYIRHELTNYDSELETLARKAGRYDAYEVLCMRVQSAIREVYPDYRGKAGMSA